MIPFNDNNAWLDGRGNLSLGFGGTDDGAADSVHPYAKGDVLVHIPLTAIGVTGGTASLTRVAAGQYGLSLSAAGTAYLLYVPIVGIQRLVRGASPHSFKLKDLVLDLIIGGANLGAHSLALYTETLPANAARSVSAFGGPLSYTVDGVAGSLPTAARANPYRIVATLGSPAFVVDDFTTLIAEWGITTGTTSGTATVVGVMAHMALAIY